jgi:hypothetical protein
MMQPGSVSFKAVMAQVAQELVAIEHRRGTAFVRTPLLYPSGSTVVIRVDDGPGNFLVSDAGFGYQDSELMGTASIFQRHARAVAENAGVRFDGHAFFAGDVPVGRLAGSIVTIANCSQEASALAMYKLSERKVADDSETLYRRLVTVFPKEKVERDVDFIGASNTRWHFAAVVNIAKRPAVFEAVASNHLSVAYATTKFHDVARLEQPPKRIAVVRSKEELKTYLGVLSQAANVIESDASDATIAKLARAA